MGQTFRKFKAPTLDEAFRLMRVELGQDAVVVRTAQVREGGLLGFLGRTMIELTASTPEIGASEGHAPRAAGQLAAVARKYAATAQALGSDETVADSVEYFQRIVRDAQKRMALDERAQERDRAAVVPFRKPSKEGGREPESVQELRREMGEMRDILQVLVAETPGAGLPPEFTPHYRHLVRQGVSQKTAASIMTSIASDGNPDVLRDPRVLEERLRMELRKSVQTTGGIAIKSGACHVVALVGATGVGKTTNLAKLAALFSVRERAGVALVTADTYRVAAPEQLRVYANIIGLPMKIARDAGDMAETIRGLRDYDLILVDTAGGSQFNRRQIDELSHTLQAAQPDEVMLMLSANTQLEELRTVVEEFEPTKPTSLFYSKLDETQRYGALFSLAVEVGMPLSYLSVGQNVPDDIVLAQSASVANLVLQDGDNRIGSSTQSA